MARECPVGDVLLYDVQGSLPGFSPLFCDIFSKGATVPHCLELVDFFVELKSVNQF